jgi:hypothetical protein
MKTLMTFMTLSTMALFGAACGVETDNVGTSSQGIFSEYWLCTQQCADGGTRYGYGMNPSEAYQDLQGCGAGGGEISCSLVDDEPIITEV